MVLEKILKFKIHLSFFSNSKMSLYFDIYTKLYIGYLNIDCFKEFYKDFEMELKKVIEFL